MASIQEQPTEFEETLQALNEALDLLTDTLRGVRGCEYPRLVAREIQALVVACVAHEQARQAPGPLMRIEAQRAPTDDSPAAPEMLQSMVRTLEAREAEVVALRTLVLHGVSTIETHTLTDPEGTAVMHGDYQCINANAIEQWLHRAQEVLRSARRSTEA